MEIVKSYPLVTRETFDFQAPTGANTLGLGYPFNLSNDAGILKNGYENTLVSYTFDYPPLNVGDVVSIDTSDPAAYYSVYQDETELPYDPEADTYWNPIYFYEKEIVLVESSGYHGTNPIKFNFLGEITYVDLPIYLTTDEYQPIGYLGVKNIQTLENTTNGYPLEYWKVQLTPGVARNNFVQNENRRSKMSIAGGWATYSWPVVYTVTDPENPENDNPRNIHTGSPTDPDEYFESITTYDGSFQIVEDDIRHRPWTNVKIGVSHILTTFYIETNFTNVLKTIEGEPSPEGYYANYDYVESTLNETSSRSYDQAEINETYTFQSDDYITQKSGMPDATRVIIDGTYGDTKAIFREAFIVGFYGVNPTGSFDDRVRVYFDSSIFESRDWLSDNHDDNVDENTMIYPGPSDAYPNFAAWWNNVGPGFDTNSPIFPQHYTITNDGYYLGPSAGMNPYHTSDKFSYPDPGGFFSPPND
jgi:hypothetical protein